MPLHDVRSALLWHQLINRCLEPPAYHGCFVRAASPGAGKRPSLLSRRRNQTCTGISQATWNSYMQSVWTAATAQGLDPTSYGATVFAFPNMLGNCWAGLAVIGCYGDYTCWTCARITTCTAERPHISRLCPRHLFMLCLPCLTRRCACNVDTSTVPRR